MNILTRFSILLAAAALLTACGGGGGGSKDSTPPVSNPPPPSTPAPTPDPPIDPTPDPQPDPSEVSAYKSSIERMVGALLLIEKAGKSDAKRIPEFIADQVTAHGPTPQCESSCDQHYFQAVLSEGQEVTVVQFADANKNGQFDYVGESLPYMITNVYGITGSVFTMSAVSEGLTTWNFMLNARYDEQHKYGAQIGSTTSMVYGGALTVRELGNGRLRIGDYDLAPSDTRNIFLSVLAADGTREVLLDTKFTMDTNVGDSDAIDATFDWIPFGGGAGEAFETLETLNFGEIGGQTVLEAGSFQYTVQASSGEPVVVRVSVSADPAHLFLEIDLNNDGVADSTGYLAQSELTFNLP